MSWVQNWPKANKICLLINSGTTDFFCLSSNRDPSYWSRPTYGAGKRVPIRRLIWPDDTAILYYMTADSLSLPLTVLRKSLSRFRWRSKSMKIGFLIGPTLFIFYFQLCSVLDIIECRCSESLHFVNNCFCGGENAKPPIDSIIFLQERRIL